MRDLDLVDHINRKDKGKRKIQPEGMGVVNGSGREFLHGSLEIGRNLAR